MSVYKLTHQSIASSNPSANSLTFMFMKNNNFFGLIVFDHMESHSTLPLGFCDIWQYESATDVDNMLIIRFTGNKTNEVFAKCPRDCKINKQCTHHILIMINMRALQCNRLRQTSSSFPYKKYTQFLQVHARFQSIHWDAMPFYIQSDDQRMPTAKFWLYYAFNRIRFKIVKRLHLF